MLNTICCPTCETGIVEVTLTNDNEAFIRSWCNAPQRCLMTAETEEKIKRDFMETHRQWLAWLLR